MLVAGSFAGDEPRPTDPTSPQSLRTYHVRRLLPGTGFTTVISWRMVIGLVTNIRRSDLVHVSAARELIPVLASIIALIFRRPFIAQPHGMLTSRYSRGHRLADIICRPLYRRAAATIALTRDEAQDLRGWLRTPHPEILVLPNPIDPRALELAQPIHPTADTLFDVLFLARLHPRKRVSDFIAAAALAADRRFPMRFSIVGPDGGDLQSVLSATSQLRNLVYEGALPADQVAMRIASCHIFVLPSWKEPFGNALVAALAARKPVVIARSASLSTLVSKYGAGIVYQDGDVGSLVSALEDLACDTSAYGKSSEGAATLVETQFSVQAQQAGLRRAYSLAIHRASLDAAARFRVDPQ
jgi:glycosyltransferase involved in cell wall biosynthesis